MHPDQHAPNLQRTTRDRQMLWDSLHQSLSSIEVLVRQRLRARERSLEATAALRVWLQVQQRKHDSTSSKREIRDAQGRRRPQPCRIRSS